MNVYGPRITQARKLAGLTQQQLADALGVEVQTIKRRENPRGKEPKKLDRIAIAHVCGISIDFLEGTITDPEEAADAIVRKVREHDTQIATLREEIAALGEELLTQLEQMEARLRGGPPGAAGETPRDQDAKGQP